MSSYLRRIQKNIAKSMGYRRNRISGMIEDADGNEVGKHWPRVSAPTKEGI